MKAVDMYNKFGKIPCLKCGLDLLEKSGCVPVCNETECLGIIISRETLELWAKEQGKSLNYGL